LESVGQEEDSEGVGQEGSKGVGWEEDEDSDGAQQEHHEYFDGVRKEDNLKGLGQEHHGGFTDDEGEG
jgi:hypothetical protein